MQDDLDQLLDMLPADLGATLINHPKRAQLIEVRAAWVRRRMRCKGLGEGGLGAARRAGAQVSSRPKESFPPKRPPDSCCICCRLCWTWAGAQRPGFRASLLSTCGMLR